MNALGFCHNCNVTIGETGMPCATCGTVLTELWETKTMTTPNETRQQTCLGVDCECIAWADDYGRSIAEHHKYCSKYTPPPPDYLNPCRTCGAYHGGLPLQHYTTYLDALTDSALLNGCCSEVRAAARSELAALRTKLAAAEAELDDWRAADRERKNFCD